MSLLVLGFVHSPERQLPVYSLVPYQIIYTTIRFITPEELKWYTEDCISLKQAFPDLIAGTHLIPCLQHIY